MPENSLGCGVLAHLLTALDEAIERTVSHAVWRLSYTTAESTGCDYPGEPAGVSVRVLLNGGPLVTESRVLRAVRAAVADCDACYGYCTVRPKS